MKTCTAEELNEKLESHVQWLHGEIEGQRLDLTGADLKEANLRWASLRGAYFKEASLREANLEGADLEGVYLKGANLTKANLTKANLAKADLRGASLRWASLRGTDLEGANLEGANFRGANLEGADLTEASLKEAKLPNFQICPEKGSFVAWKKAGQQVVELLIPAEAKRTSSLVGRKCRAEFVDVLEISWGGKTAESVRGGIYEVGKRTFPDRYCDDIRVQCSHGIHFFITKKEAEDW